MLGLLLTLTACGQAQDAGTTSTEVQALEPGKGAKDGGADTVAKVVIPQIAYTYRYAFRVPTDELGTIQDRHVALCDRLGPARCRILGMARSDDAETAEPANLKLVVRADLARSFGNDLRRITARAGGSQTGQQVEAEDLSKQIVDTEARLRSKQALAARLMQLLQTRNGPVTDLVAAERSVAEVQEEIDAAQSWLAEARGRVTMSTFEIGYSPNQLIGGGFVEPLRQSMASVAATFGFSLGLLIQLIAGLLPWAAVLGTIYFAMRFIRRRWEARSNVD